jgi:3-oxoacyl-[acyl-carrier protein] reductase
MALLNETAPRGGDAPARPLQGRGAIVTGGARGIGRAIAERLAAQGAAVCVCDLDEGPAAAVAAALDGAGATALGVGGDVASAEDCRRIAEAAAERFGALHILVNNAGLTRDAMVHKMADADWDVVNDVVLRGAFNCVRAVAPWFRDRERRAPRRIVSISSVSGIYGSPGNVNYAAAKAGLIGFTRSLAKEWARFGVTANAIAPGFIDTRLTAAREAGQPLGLPPEVREALVARIPAGRAGTPEDVAAAVAFFCGDDAGFVTGQVLEVHGGLPDISVTA